MYIENPQYMQKSCKNFKKTIALLVILLYNHLYNEKRVTNLCKNIRHFNQLMYFENYELKLQSNFIHCDFHRIYIKKIQLVIAHPDGRPEHKVALTRCELMGRLEERMNFDGNILKEENSK